MCGERIPVTAEADIDGRLLGGVVKASCKAVRSTPLGKVTPSRSSLSPAAAAV
jgi:hypothetical protein